MRTTRHPSKRLACEVGGSSFVNVLVILAALFLLGSLTEPYPYHGSGLELPRIGQAVSMAHANREDAIVIAVTRDGKFFFRTDPAQPSQLPARIRQSLSLGAERKIYIKADARARYGWVGRVLDGVQTSGIDQIVFLVDQRKAVPVATSR